VPARRLLPVLLFVLALAGCGSADLQQQAQDRADQVRTDVARRADDIRKEIRTRRQRIIARVEKVIGDLKQIVPAAPVTRPEVQRRAGNQDIEQFLTGVIENVDAYWTKTLRAAGRPEPRVSYVFVPEGERRATGCGTPADDRAAFYCPPDDTIYFAQKFAADLYDGVAQGLPGGDNGEAGSFGVAYVLAHEYGHNLQNELGIFKIGASNSVEPFELQADCLAGSWGNSAFAQGGLTDKDIREAIATVESVGDFDIDNQQHHGTPSERRDAWLAGFRGGDPSVCTSYVPQA
jgi:uncharacterized protein